jgi:hypothetical protein
MSDIEVVEKIYASMAARDLETLAQLIDESCVITQDAALPWEANTSKTLVPRLAALNGAITSAVTTHDVHGRRRRDPGGSHQRRTTAVNDTPLTSRGAR